MDFESLLENAIATNTYPAAIISLADPSRSIFYTFSPEHELVTGELPASFIEKISTV